jgi:ribonuclease Z
MEAIFLGTGAMVATKDRNQLGVFIQHEGVGLLVDCGEATQRQFRIAGKSLHKIDRILLSHLHGDHCLGLPGILQTLSATDYEKTLYIYGPIGTKKFVDGILSTFIFDNVIKLKICEIESGKVFDNETLKVFGFPLNHKMPCLAYRFIEKDKRRVNMKNAKALGLKAGPVLGKLQRGNSVEVKGKKILPDDVTYIVKGKVLSLIFDTSLNENCIKVATDSDVLICEATYEAKDEEKAREYFHLTSAQAATIASQANVKKLYLAHFSQRYKTLEQLEKDAKDIFPETYIAHDFLKVKL